MEDNFETWKHILDKGIDDCIPDFNKDHIWGRIQPRIQMKKRTNNWIRYAAAIILGMFIGGGALKIFTSRSPVHPEEITAKVSQPVRTPVKIIPLQAQSQLPVSIAGTKVKTKITIKPKPQHSYATAPVLQIDQATSTLNEKAIPTAAIVTIPKTIKETPPTIHLLDIQNEDIDAIVTTNSYKHRALQLGYLISPKRLPNVPDNNLPATVVSNYIKN